MIREWKKWKKWKKRSSVLQSLFKNKKKLRPAANALKKMMKKMGG